MRGLLWVQYSVDSVLPEEATVKRYSAYEFPEYIDWTPDDEAQRISTTVAAGPRAAVIADNKRNCWTSTVGWSPHAHDIQLKRWVKQGVITKAWLEVAKRLLRSERAS